MGETDAGPLDAEGTTGPSGGLRGERASEPRRFTLTAKIGILLLLPFGSSLVGVLCFARYVGQTRTYTHFVNVAGRQRMLSAELRDYEHMIVALGQEEDRAGLQSRVEDFQRALTTLQEGGQILDGEIDAAPTELQPHLVSVASLWNGLRPDLRAVVEAPRGDARFVEAGGRLEQRLPGLADTSSRFIVAVEALHDRERRGIAWTLGLLAAANLAVLLVGLLVTRHFIVRPVLDVERVARRIRDGDFSQRLDVVTRDELGTLARTFNEMSERVEGLLGERVLHVEQLELLEAALEASIDPFLIADAQGTIVWVNEGFVRQNGYAREEVLGKTPRILKSGLTDPAIYPAMWSTVLSARVWRGEVINRRKNGSTYVSEVTVAPVIGRSGEVTHLVGCLRDLTEQRRLEAQLRQSQKMEAIGQLAGGVAHDFNNLLMAISGYNDLLLADLDESDPLRRHGEEVKKAADRAARLTRQLLAYSRKQVLLPKVINLNALVSDVEKMVRRLIGENIACATGLAPDLGSTKADPGQIEQVIMNLAINARDAMPKGGTLTLETSNVEVDEAYALAHADSRPGPHVMLAVSDTGCGMDAETRAHVFEPFFTTKEQGKGTGLGLATVYGIVKQSGGHITLYSEPGHGTSFKIYLPRVDAPAEALPADRPAEASPRGTETILLVEDEDLVRGLVREALQSGGYAVLDACDGNEALQVSERHEGPIHLLMTDMVMPGMSGVELAKRLAPLRPQTKVLYMSGYTEHSMLQEGVLNSGAAFVQKPVSLIALGQKVREVLTAPATGADGMLG